MSLVSCKPGQVTSPDIGEPGQVSSPENGETLHASDDLMMSKNRHHLTHLQARLSNFEDII